MPVIRVRVQPGSSQSRIEEFRAGVLRVRVTAPAEKGRANAATLALLAKFLGVGATQVKIVRGAASRNKVIEVTGMDAAKLELRIGELKTVGCD